MIYVTFAIAAVSAVVAIFAHVEASARSYSVAVLTAETEMRRRSHGDVA
jgi:hypothetical protein